MTERFRRLPEEEQAKVNGLLLQLPEDQREGVLAGIDEYLSGKMTEQQFQDRWTRLTSLRETGQPRDPQDQIWAALFSFDHNPLGD